MMCQQGEPKTTGPFFPLKPFPSTPPPSAVPCFGAFQNPGPQRVGIYELQLSSADASIIVSDFAKASNSIRCPTHVSGAEWRALGQAEDRLPIRRP